MRTKHALGLLLTAAFGLACAHTLNTSVHANPKADFSKYKTFQITGSRIETDAQAMLSQGIAQRLEAKGLKRVDQNANLVVDPVLIRNAAQKPYDSEGASWWTGAASAEPTGNMPIGALVVNITDPATNELVWRGVADGTVPPSGALARDKVAIALDRLFADFPPKPGAK